MKTLTVLVPRPDTSPSRMIDPGSGIVTADASRPFVVVYFEGNRYHASNIVTFEDKVLHAAGRLDKRYPTIAMGQFQTEDFDVVGTFSFDEDWRSHQLEVTNAEALSRWTS